jgi:hypothetical protein
MGPEGIRAGRLAPEQLFFWSAARVAPEKLPAPAVAARPLRCARGVEHGQQNAPKVINKQTQTILFRRTHSTNACDSSGGYCRPNRFSSITRDGVRRFRF